MVDGTFSEPWHRAFELAWEALQAGSFPVGAVVLDGAGECVVEGRNRMFEDDAPPGQMAGNAIAHAEMNALAQLPPAEHPGWTLYTTLEPCLLCTSALYSSQIETVHYASADTFCEGIDRVPPLLNATIQRLWSTRIGPLPGPLGAWGRILPDLWRHLRAGHASGAEPVGQISELSRQCIEAGVLAASSSRQALELARRVLIAHSE